MRAPAMRPPGAEVRRHRKTSHWSIGLFAMLVLCAPAWGQKGGRAARLGARAPITKAEVADALGLQEADIEDFSFSVTSDGMNVPDEPGVLVQASGGGILLSTGDAADGGTGDTDFLDDDEPDVTTFTLTLTLPVDTRSLAYTSRFNTSETGMMAHADEATLDVSTGAPTLTLGKVGVGGPAFPTELRAVDVSSLAPVSRPRRKGPRLGEGVQILRNGSAATVTLTFTIQDDVDGDRDSGLLLGCALFTESSIVSAQELADSLFAGASNPSVEVKSGNLRIVDVLSAAPGGFTGSLFLSTGLASDQGFGDTDLGCDGMPDETTFSMTLDVPQGQTPPIKSLVFSTQFRTTELPVPGTDSAAATLDAQAPIEAGSVMSSATPQDPPMLRAFDVEGKSQVTVTFEVTDDADQGRRDSALFLTGFFFSEYEASLLSNPRPADATIKTGTYAYSKFLIGASGSTLPFSFMAHYNSAPRRTSGHMGPNWGHNYEWAVITLGNGELLVRTGAGSIQTFEEDPAGSNTYSADGQVFATLTKLASGPYTYVYVTPDQIVYSFDDDGKLLTIADPNGNLNTLSYSGDLLESVEDTRGQKATFTYENDRLTKVAYAFQEVTFEYDGNGDLITHFNTAGDPTRFTYDSSHRILAGTDTNGITFVQNTYDELHRVTQQVDAKNAVTLTDYTFSTSTITDRAQNQRVTTYDPLDRQESVTDDTGAEWSYGYDEDDNLVRTTNPRGNEDRTTFDENGNAVEEIDPNLEKVVMVYDQFNRPTQSTNQEQKSIFFFYDGNGNLLTYVNELGDTETYEYDGRGLRTKVTDRNGNVTLNAYTAEGDLESTTDPRGATTRFDYDDLGRRTELIDANGNRLRFTFDEGGRVTTTTNALGAVSKSEYDKEGRLVSETDPLGNKRTYEHTPTGKVSVFRDGVGAPTKTTYNGEDWPTRVEDPLGNATLFTYDETGRIATSTDALGGVVESTYDLEGNRTRIEDPRHKISEFFFDSLGRCERLRNPLGKEFSTTFDKRGLVESTTNGRGQQAFFGYDDASQLTSIKLSTHTITYERDRNGNPTAIVGLGGRRYEQEFDAANQIVSTSDVSGNTIRYEYDAVGNVSSVQYSDGVEVSYTYDATNRLTSVTDWLGRTTLYRYDLADRLVSATLPDGSVREYTYDDAGRLLSITDDSPQAVPIFQVTYELGPSGLRDKETAAYPLEPPVTTETRSFTYNDWNQLVSDGRDTFTYDDDGNMTRGVIGRLPVDLAFDERNQLVSMGASTYAYDDEGRRIGSTINGEERQYVHGLGGQVLEEHDWRGRIVARYVYGVGLISRHDPKFERDPDDIAKSIAIYHFDSRGSTLALTDLDGQVTDMYAYDPYGLIVAREGRTRNPFTYNGRDGVMDDGNGLYFMRTRYYEPRLMRFLSVDQFAYGTVSDSQSLNRYMFARGNPVHQIDPTGKWFGLDDLVMAIGGAIVNVAGQFISDLASGSWSSWDEYTGAAIEGAVWGEVLLYTGNPFLAGVAGAAVGNAAGQGLRIAAGKLGLQEETSFDFADFGENVAFGAALGLLPGGGGAKAIGKGATKKALSKTYLKVFGKQITTRLIKKHQVYAAKTLARKYITAELLEAGIQGGIKGVGERYGVTSEYLWKESQDAVIGPVSQWLGTNIGKARAFASN